MIHAHDDLNLLSSLTLLLETRSVTAAAARAGVTQSAMSRTLARLRDAFADPLFVRTRRGMEPTAAALALSEPTRIAIESARAVFASRTTFDPAVAQRTFGIASTDFAALVVIPPLVERLRHGAPGISLASVPLPASPAEALEAGTIDLAIAFGSPSAAGLRWQLLFEDELACVARRRHPAFTRRLTRARYLELAHLSITPAAQTGDAVDRVLARDGLHRRVVARTTHFLLAPALLRDQDLVLTTGARVAAELARMAALEIVPAPIDIGAVRIGQIWHERTHRDPAHVWFRSQIREVTATAR